MSYFQGKVLYKNGKPCAKIGVKIDFGWLGGINDGRTYS
jgi:hypothetical protein